MSKPKINAISELNRKKFLVTLDQTLADGGMAEGVIAHLGSFKEGVIQDFKGVRLTKPDGQESLYVVDGSHMDWQKPLWKEIDEKQLSFRPTFQRMATVDDYDPSNNMAQLSFACPIKAKDLLRVGNKERKAWAGEPRNTHVNEKAVNDSKLTLERIKIDCKKISRVLPIPNKVGLGIDINELPPTKLLEVLRQVRKEVSGLAVDADSINLHMKLKGAEVNNSNASISSAREASEIPSYNEETLLIVSKGFSEYAKEISDFLSSMKSEMNGARYRLKEDGNQFDDMKFY
jgi:hypothetical protein